MKLNTRYKVVLSIIFIVAALMYLFIMFSNVENFDDNNMNFKLYNLEDNLMHNTDFEYPEQIMLQTYIQKTDNVLQLGGNLGASCICVDKLIDKNNVNICVEPNSNVIDVLKKNKEYNNSTFNIIYGVISDKLNLKLTDESKSTDVNLVGSKITNEGTLDVTSYSLKNIENIDKINVLFADCEGCLEKFLDEYPWFLKQLRLVLYEKDQPHICNYEKIEQALKHNGFTLIAEENNNFVWKK